MIPIQIEEISMVISRDLLVRSLIAFSFFAPFSSQGAEENENKEGDLSDQLAAKFEGVSLVGIQDQSQQPVAPVEIQSVPNSFKKIECDVSFKGGKARVRLHTEQDINKTWIERMCSHDPTDPMDTSDPNTPLPTREEVCQLIAQSRENAGQLLYGIYNEEDGQIMGAFGLSAGRHFYNAIECTISIHRNFRARGIATSVNKSMFEMIRKVGCVEPVFYIEGSINADNTGSIRAAEGAGMIPFPQQEPSGVHLYYYPLDAGLGKPTPIPPKLVPMPSEKADGGLPIYCS
jgi:RimJ/RimL family protein N-acetyltransferase